MKFLRKFNEHTSYEAEVNVGGDFTIPNVSYCKDVKDVHFNPYNLIKFYVGEITGTTQQTVSIYTDETTSIPIQVSKGNKWYSYVLPKDNGLYKIKGDSVKKVVVKADMSYKTNKDSSTVIIPSSTVEASFKGSNTSNLTSMCNMFSGCTSLTSLDLSGWNTSKVTDMMGMFYNCSGLTSLDLSSFDTSKVVYMDGMFSNCSGLTSLDLRNFNTSKVTNMGNMFLHCTNLATLDLSGWNISEGTSIYNMFNGCTSLTSIRMVGCSEDTIDKIRSKKPSGATIVTK